MLAGAPAASEPIPVYTGPTRTGAALIAAVAADVEQQTPRHHGKKSRIASKKPDAAAQSNAESKDAGNGTKPGKHAEAKPDAAPKANQKPAATTDKPAAKPTKPKTTAKRSTKPAPKAGEAKPAR